VQLESAQKRDLVGELDFVLAHESARAFRAVEQQPLLQQTRIPLDVDTSHLFHTAHPTEWLSGNPSQI